MVKHRAGSIPALGTKLLIAGWSSLEARRAHNPEVVGSNPTPASIITFFVVLNIVFFMEIILRLKSGNYLNKGR